MGDLSRAELGLEFHYATTGPMTQTHPCSWCALAMRGFPLVPVCRHGKKCVLSEWQHKPFPSKPHGALHQIYEWDDQGFNVGVRLDNTVVIDCDGEEPYARICEMGITSSHVIKSPRGWHLYFAMPPGVPVKPCKPWGNDGKLDLLAGNGKYVMAEGSVVKQADGSLRNYYRLSWPDRPLDVYDRHWFPERAQTVAQAPSTLLMMNRPVSGRGGSFGANDPLDVRIRKARNFIFKIDSIAGSGGENQCFRAACHLARFAIPPDIGWDLMQEWNTAKACPPWGLAKLRYQFESGYKDTGRDLRSA